MHKLFILFALVLSIYAHADTLRDKDRQLRLRQPMLEQTAPTQFADMPDPFLRPSSTLQDIGFTFPLIAAGQDPILTFTLPYYPGTQLAGSELLLHLIFSKYLSPQSSIIVLINNLPLQQATVEQVGYKGILRIPLEALKYQDKAISFQIQCHFFSNTTSDADASLLWMHVDPSSEVRWAIDATQPLPIQSFLENANQKVPLILMQTTPATIEALLQVASTIGAYYHPWHLSTTFEQAEGKRIFIGDFSQDLEFRNNDLYLSPAGATQFAQQFPKVASPTLADISTHFLLPTWHRISFADLHGLTQSLEGGNPLIFNLSFTLADIGGALPSALKAIINLSSQKEIFLHCRLNGVHIHTSEIEQKKQTYEVTIPIQTLEPKNNFEIILTSDQQIQATLYNNSYLAWEGIENEVALTLADFPWHFANKGLLFISELSPPYFQTAALLLEIWSQHIGKPATFDLHVGTMPDNLTPFHYCIAITNHSDLLQFHPPQINNNTALTQTFFFDNLPTLTLSNLSSTPLSIPHNFSMLTSSAAFYSNNAWSILPTANHDLSAEANEETEWNLWHKFKLFALIPLAMLVLIFVRHLYRNLTKGEKDS